VNSTTTLDMRSFRAPVGVAARTRWSTTAAAFGSAHHSLAAIKPMPSSYVVKNVKGIRHRPPENSS
jgi:hypothetical protein